MEHVVVIDLPNVNMVHVQIMRLKRPDTWIKPPVRFKRGHFYNANAQNYTHFPSLSTMEIS